ncbi:hypothetical protein GL218_01340 [Daldinia childiae]|uniref:uncharacterized protein n=1 Tax=Daldinia childiae TaxID=326645 RepID=UPI0014478173|nr:uncharacterized protein GL218_01340 [Daldinia childiae]KAF3064607.1 hypothetical protein GL218_01340 [Daldinia childiae]
MASLYELTIPVLTRVLRTEESLLKKAEEHAKTTGTPVEELVAARLAPDMFSLSKQVGVTVLFARIVSHLLAGKELPPTQIGEWSLEENYSFIAGALELLAEIKPEDLNGRESEIISFNYVNGKYSSYFNTTLKLRASNANNFADVTRFLVPSVYFHLTTLYDILRHKGVPLGKANYLEHLVADWEFS